MQTRSFSWFSRFRYLLLEGKEGKEGKHNNYQCRYYA